MVLPASVSRARYSVRVLTSRFTALQSVTMSIPTLDDSHCQRNESTTRSHWSHAPVQGNELEPSGSTNTDSVAFFDKETKRWKLDVGDKKMM